GGGPDGPDEGGVTARRLVRARRQRSRISAGRRDGIQRRAVGSWSRSTQSIASATASFRWKWRPRTVSWVRNTYAAKRAGGGRHHTSHGTYGAARPYAT